jgi:glycosyltransferase involved in cell wall biosynthesis
VGALDRIANAAAVRFLVTEVWPRVQPVHPSAKLHIVGANPPRWLCRLSKHVPSMEVRGWVPDLSEVWAQTDVAVCPSLVGGGLLLKVAQPMCAGRPVVTTAMGNEGIAAPSEALAVADSADAFAVEVSRLLADRSLWKRMAQAARKHIAGAMDWETGMRSLEAAYAFAISAGHGR